MDKKEKLKKIRGSIFNMIIGIISAYILTYAWFNYSEKVNAPNVEVNTDPAKNVEISLDQGSNWANIGDLNISNDFTFGELVTSNGIDFYYAHTKQDDGTPLTFQTAAVGDDYLEYQVWFRSNVPVAILLEEKSYVKPEAGVTSNDLVGSAVERKSLYGDFSKDIIAGAVRVAAVENNIVGETHTPQSTTKLVWAPNKSYELSYTGGVYSVNISSVNSQDYDYVAVTDPDTFAEARVVNLKDNVNASASEKTAGGDPILTYINDSNVKSITIRIWVEGNDREALTALKGGLFTFSLSFAGISKNFDNVPPSVTANPVLHSITGFNTGMEYTIDYGNNWITYATDPEPYINSGTTVYVRKSETTTTFASAYTTLEF